MILTLFGQTSAKFCWNATHEQQVNLEMTVDYDLYQTTPDTDSESENKLK